MESRAKANKIFYQINIAVVLLLAVIFSFSYIFYERLKFGWLYFFGRIEYVCDCMKQLAISDHPAVYLFLTGSAFVFGMLALVMAGRALYFRYVTSRFVGNCLRKRKKYLSRRLQKLSEELGLSKKVVEIEEKSFQIFSYGFLNPKICISSKMARRLDDTELKAVLLHEQSHLKFRDPVKFFITKLFARTFFFVPGLKYLSRQFIVFSEIAADEWAIEKTKSSRGLIKAVYKILKQKEDVLESQASVSYFSLTLEERINKLIDDGYIVQNKYLTGKRIVQMFVLALFSFIFIFSMNISSKALAMHDTNECKMDEMITANSCSMEIESESCSVENFNMSVEKLSCE